MKTKILLFLLILSNLAIGQDFFLTTPKQSIAQNTVVVSSCTTCSNASVVANVGNSYTPTSAADLANAANSGKTAYLTNTFSLTGTTLAANQILVPDGGAITGTGIVLNGAQFVINNSSGFASSARFTTLYGGCLTPELFQAAVSSNDVQSFEAMILNSNYGINQGSAYTVSTGNTGISRSGTFNWSGIGSKIDCSYKNGSTESYLFQFTDFRLEICDIEFDGNSDINASLSSDSLFKFTRGTYAFDGIEVHHFSADLGARIVIVNMLLDETQDTFSTVTDSEFHDLNVIGDGVFGGGGAGDGNGIGRVFLIQPTNFNSSSGGSTVFTRTKMYNVTGEAADPVHFTVASIYDHSYRLFFEDCDFWGNSRRDIKMQNSGLTITNSRFTRISQAKLDALNTAVGATLTGGGRAYQPTGAIALTTNDNPNSSEYHIAPVISNSVFDTADELVSTHISLGGVRDAIITGNTFSGGVHGSSAVFSVNGKQLNNLVDNNTFTNTNLILFGECDNTGYTTFSNNDINEAITNGDQSAIMRSSLSTVTFGNVKIDSNTFNLTFSNAWGNFYGVLGSHLSGNTIKRLSFINNTVNYLGNPGLEHFMEVEGNLDNTNIIQNNTVPGISRIGAFDIVGSSTFVNTNNVDGSGNPLTVQ